MPVGPDANGDGRVDQYERSLASANASPSSDGRRQWEHGGWKEGTDDAANAYQLALTFFHGWENEEGPNDCEPLQRAFRLQTESYGTFGVYSVNEGWGLQPSATP
jgi:hypothetical protein